MTLRGGLYFGRFGKFGMIEKENPGRDDNVGFRPSRFGFETLGCNFFAAYVCV